MVAKRRSQSPKKTSPKSAAPARRAARAAKPKVPALAKSAKVKPAAAKAPAKAMKKPAAPSTKAGPANSSGKPAKPAAKPIAKVAPRPVAPAPVALPAKPEVVVVEKTTVVVAPIIPFPVPVAAKPAAAAPRPAAPKLTPPPPPPPPPPVRRPLVTLTLVTRKSPLAVAQADLVLARFAERIPNYAFRVFKLVTTGDRQAEWSLEQEGGKGLFTGELEQALTDHRADVAVHSAKDLPTEMPAGLALAGFLPREDPRDVLVIREDVARPLTIATGSPRRRMQLERQFTKATFSEIRGNVDTRMRKIAEERVADATVLAAAGLKRLGITEWPGLRFQPLPLAVSVPAVGQAAVAVQARGETATFLRPHLDEPTRIAVELERAFLRLMGGGCHTAFAVHYDGTGVHVFHESCGYQRFAVSLADALEPGRVAERLLVQLKLRG